MCQIVHIHIPKSSSRPKKKKKPRYSTTHVILIYFDNKSVYSVLDKKLLEVSDGIREYGKGDESCVTFYEQG